MRKFALASLFLLLLTGGHARKSFAADEVLVPQIDGDFWQVAGDPDLGKYTLPNTAALSLKTVEVLSRQSEK